MSKWVLLYKAKLIKNSLSEKKARAGNLDDQEVEIKTVGCGA